MATLLNPFLRADDANGNSVSGGQLAVFEAGTTTPVTTYSDRALTTAQAQPLVANSAGEFEQSFVAAGIYKIRVSDADGVTLYENDNVRIADRPDDPVFFESRADVLADTTTYAEGTQIVAINDGSNYLYVAAASGASDHDTTNAGGQKLYYERRFYETVAQLLASTEPARGAGKIWEAGGFRYEEAASGASDEHVTTAGGVKLYVLPDVSRYNVKAFGALGDGATDDTTAIETAWGVSNRIYFPAGDYAVGTLDLDGGETSTQKEIIGDSATISGTRVNIIGLYYCRVEALTIDADTLYIEGLRSSTWQDVVIKAFVKWGKYTATGGTSWSTYWNKFERVFFEEGIEATTSATDAVFNANTFDTCEFRAGDQDAIWTLLENASANGAFSGNTFVSCDASYDPIWDIETGYSFTSITWIGGYMDTGTDWYASGSDPIIDMNVIGVRNPSSVVDSGSLDANIWLSHGGARPKRNLPISTKSYWKWHPNALDAFAQKAISFPLPYTGEYTISWHVTKNAGDLDAVTFENLTSGDQQFNCLLTDGYSSFTFSAEAGDVIELDLDGNASADIDVDFLYLTLGLGVYEAEKASYETVVTATNAVAADLLVVDIGTNKRRVSRIEIHSASNASNAAGFEKIVIDLGIVTASSSASVTVDEVSRCSVNGPGGTSQQSGTLALTTSTSGTEVTLIGTLSGSPASCRVKVIEGFYEDADE